MLQMVVVLVTFVNVIFGQFHQELIILSVGYRYVFGMLFCAGLLLKLLNVRHTHEFIHFYLVLVINLVCPGNNR